MDQADQIKHRVDDEQVNRKDLKKLITVLEENYATNQEKRDQHKDEPLKYMESEERLAEQLHEIQGLAAYPERISIAVDEGLVEAALSILQHPNIDICQLCITLLYELCEKELAESHPEIVSKVLTRYQDNSIWTLLQKVIECARVDKRRKGLQDVSERTEEDMIE